MMTGRAQRVGRSLSAPRNRRQVIARLAAASGIGLVGGIGLYACRGTMKSADADVGLPSDDAEEDTGRSRWNVRSVRGFLSGKTDRSTPIAAPLSDSISGAQRGTGPLFPSPAALFSSRFTAWVTGPVMSFAQAPAAYIRAVVVMNSSLVRIWSAEQSVEAKAAETERVAARAFAHSATVYAAIMSGLVNRAKATAAAKKVAAAAAAAAEGGGRGGGGGEGGEGGGKSRSTSMNAATTVTQTIPAAQAKAVGDFSIFAREFTATFESAMEADAAMAAASNSVASAVRSALAAGEATRAAALRLEAERERTGGTVRGQDLAVSRAALDNAKATGEVARRGMVVVQRAQIARRRLRVLAAHNTNVAVTAKAAEKAIADVEKVVGVRDGDRLRARQSAALALKRCGSAIDAALACSGDVLESTEKK